MELYYAMVNILDYLAVREITFESRVRMLCLLDVLAEESVKAGFDNSIHECIESIADANDAGGCKTWVEIIDVFRELHRKGERIHIG